MPTGRRSSSSSPPSTERNRDPGRSRGMTRNSTAAAVLTAVFLAGGLAFAGDAAEKGKSLFEEKCILCHAKSRTFLQSMDREGWAKTVERMRKENGSRITDAEAEAIVDYLAKIRGPEAK